MTNINCTSKCTYQNDGKCCMDNLMTSSITLNSNDACIYYVPKSNKKIETSEN